MFEYKLIGQIQGEDAWFDLEAAVDPLDSSRLEISIVNYSFTKLNEKAIDEFGVAVLSRSDIIRLRNVLNNILA